MGRKWVGCRKRLVSGKWEVGTYTALSVSVWNVAESSNPLLEFPVMITQGRSGRCHCLCEEICLRQFECRLTTVGYEIGPVDNYGKHLCDHEVPDKNILDNNNSWVHIPEPKHSNVPGCCLKNPAFRQPVFIRCILGSTKCIHSKLLQNEMSRDSSSCRMFGLALWLPGGLRRWR